MIREFDSLQNLKSSMELYSELEKITMQKMDLLDQMESIIAKNKQLLHQVPPPEQTQKQHTQRKKQHSKVKEISEETAERLDFSLRILKNEEGQLYRKRNKLIEKRRQIQKNIWNLSLQLIELPDFQIITKDRKRRHFDEEEKTNDKEKVFEKMKEDLQRKLEQESMLQENMHKMKVQIQHEKVQILNFRDQYENLRQRTQELKGQVKAKRERMKKVEMEYIQQGLERKNLTKRQYLVLKNSQTEEWQIQIQKNILIYNFLHEIGNQLIELEDEQESRKMKVGQQSKEYIL